MTSASQEDIAVTRFKEYLRINTSQPEPDYVQAAKFYQSYAKELGLSFTQIKLPERTVEVLSWEGKDPTLQSIMLYCHTDVVPSYPEYWKCDPFGAHKDEEGNIYARGAQDMKCVGIQYLEAIRKLKTAGKRFKRTFHVTFCPDEEIGGANGMAIFVESGEFKNLNVGFGLDEGMANPGEEFRVFYGERNCWWLDVTCTGNPGHGSAFLKDTAGEKVQNVINSFLQFRQEQEARLRSDKSLTPGDVASVNLTILKGGVQHNVVPATMTAGFDVRVPPFKEELTLVEENIKKWCQEAGENVECKFHQQTMAKDITATDASNPWWVAFKEACRKANIKIRAEIFPAGTDGSYLREKGIPVFGFSPMNHTPILLHDHDEFLNEQTFLRGVEIYTHILPAVGEV